MMKVKCLVCALACVMSTGAQAQMFWGEEPDHDLRLRLRNELRLADRPSAAPNNEIEAWVQAAQLDYKTQGLSRWFDIEAYAYTVQKLIADENKSTRFYLNGHDSFYLYGASLNLKPFDNFEMKIGRFGIDKSYGTMKHSVPLLEYSSARTTPAMKEGILANYSHENWHLYGAVTVKNAGGFDTEWIDEGIWLGFNADGSIKVREVPRYNLAALYLSENFGQSVGGRYQEDHSWQWMSETYYSYVTPKGAYMKWDGKLFYASLQGYEKARNIDHETYVASGQFTWAKGPYVLQASVGKVGAKLNGLTNVNTDLVYPFDLSIDRNHHNLFSYQVGGLYKLTDDWTIGLFAVETDGYKDNLQEIELNGYGSTLLISHDMKSGIAMGLKSTLLLNKAKEYHSQDSSKTNCYDFYDVKLTFQYDFQLI